MSKSRGKENVDFYNEDEEIINDSVLLEDSDEFVTFLEQFDESLVAVSIENLRDDKGVLRTPFQMKAEPPVMRLSSNKGDTAIFTLTKDFSKAIMEKTAEVYNAYYSIDSKKNRANKAVILGMSKNDLLWLTVVSLLVFLHLVR